MLDHQDRAFFIPKQGDCVSAAVADNSSLNHDRKTGAGYWNETGKR